MGAGFNLDDYKAAGADISAGYARYERRLQQLHDDGILTDAIESAVEGAVQNIEHLNVRSFVIFGEPQSGKTEMMIALTARLLDLAHRVVIVLMNDSVQLLEQNLDRFLRSGLDPAPKKFNEILDPSVKLTVGPWVIFCKKNSADLTKLVSKVGRIKGKVVIDDEADYATPNAKVNVNERTKINELVESLLVGQGIYIGVTATPARLDLNNTFANDNAHWVKFPPHGRYTGPELFFPTTAEGMKSLGYRLRLLSDTGDDPKHLRGALLSFFVNVAYLNSFVNDARKNYSMLIHTSGRKADHSYDYQQVMATLSALRDSDHPKFATLTRDVYDLADARFPGKAKELTRFVVSNINQSDVIVMNSNTERNAAQYRRATSPATMFTIAIGGNIVSRGVTFDDLLCMFFTRDVQHKIQQDTYIQRARMFGSRGDYVKHFELFIPKSLYSDWLKCFVFHRLALSFVEAGKGTPIWLEDKRIAASSSSSVDRAAVVISSGEMSWEMFDFSMEVDHVIEESRSAIDRLSTLAELVGENSLPSHVLNFISNFSIGPGTIAIHPTTLLGDRYGDEETRRTIRRARGFMAANALERARFPKAVHHFKIFRNATGKARVFYKYTPGSGTIRFLENVAAKK